MATIRYIGTRERGLTVHLPYPYTSQSRKRAEVTFHKPGDEQPVDAAYASDLVTQGGGQFEFVDNRQAPVAEEPVTEEPVTEEPVTEEPRKGTRRSK